MLTEIGAFKKLSDTSRLSLLTSTHLARGKYLLNINKTTEAFDQLNKGLETAQPLSEAVYESDTSLLRIYYDNLVGPIYEKIGTVFLLQGRTDEAKRAFDRANTYYVTYGLNSLYTATAAVLENDETQAFLDYGGITDPSQAAEALFWLGRLAEQFPEKRPQLQAFDARLRSALRSKNQRLISAETDFWLAKLKTDHFAALAQWDSTVVWTVFAMESAKRCSEQPNADDAWTRFWLDEHINLPYFLLLADWDKASVLDACINYVKEAEDFLSQQNDNNFYYTNRELLKTNLVYSLVLRNQPGDRDQAIELYKQFIQSYADTRGYDNLDIIQKDLRDLRRVGVPFPVLPEIEGNLNR